MARRERDRSEHEVERNGPRGGPPGRPGAPPKPGPPPRGAAPAGSPQGGARRPPPTPPRPRSVAEDPNAYRSPGFQDVDQNPYKIDYAGLPKDVDEDQDGTEAPVPQGPARTPSLPRGMLGRNQDRRGTDPNAYRSPAFQDLDQLHHRYGARRRSAPASPRPPVLPEGAPKDDEGELNTEPAESDPKA